MQARTRCKFNKSAKGAGENNPNKIRIEHILVNVPYYATKNPLED